MILSNSESIQETLSKNVYPYFEITDICAHKVGNKMAQRKEFRTIASIRESLMNKSGPRLIDDLLEFP